MKYTYRTLAFAALIGASLAGYLVADKTADTRRPISPSSSR